MKKSAAKKRERRTPPSLEKVVWQDLRCPLRLMDLYWQAVKEQWITYSESSLLNFLGIAAHALSRGGDSKASAVVFSELLKARSWWVITIEEEDKAHAALKMLQEKHPRAITYEIGMTRRVYAFKPKGPKPGQPARDLANVCGQLASSFRWSNVGGYKHREKRRGELQRQVNVLRRKAAIWD